MAVWWGAFAASVVIRDQVLIGPLLVSSVTSADARAPAWKAYRARPSQAPEARSRPDVRGWVLLGRVRSSLSLASVIMAGDTPATPPWP